MKISIISFVAGLSMILLVLSPTTSHAQKAPLKTSVEEIVQNPGKYYDEAVMIQGYVQEFLKKPSQTNSFYLLKGKYDGIIQVRVQYNEPSVGKKYIVEGTVYSGQNGSSVFIHQTKISEIPDFFNWEEGNTQPQQNADNKVVKPEDENSSNVAIPSIPDKDWMFYLLIGAIVLVVIIIIVVLVLVLNKSKKPTQQPIQPAKPATPIPSVTPPPTPVAPLPDEDYKTIKIVRDPSRTLKFIPGELEIISGDDAGKTFRLTGYPTPKGSIVTLGTQEAVGDRKFAHILIDKKFKTVSRRQAEFIFVDNDKKLYVKNISRTNLTKVNDVALQPNEEAELTNGTTITAGELVFRYSI